MVQARNITVITTGFTPEAAPQLERRIVPEMRIQPRAEPIPERIPERESVPLKAPPETKPAPPPEPEAPALDLDDIDTPAYLRQGRLLN
jgi:hypothetical protein